MSKPRKPNAARELRQRRLRRNRRPRFFQPKLKDCQDYERPLIREFAAVEMNEIRANPAEQHKICPKCQQVKEVSCFHKDNREPSGWYWMCKECRKDK